MEKRLNEIRGKETRLAELKRGPQNTPHPETQMERLESECQKARHIFKREYHVEPEDAQKAIEMRGRK